MNPFSTFVDADAVKAAVKRLESLPSQKHTFETALEKQRAARAAKGLRVFEDNEEEDVAPTPQ